MARLNGKVVLFGGYNAQERYLGETWEWDGESWSELQALSPPGHAYRVLLSGIHLMQTGEVVANIAVLRELYRSPSVEELVQRKQEGAEKTPLLASEISTHDKHLDDLEQELERAYERSALPLEPTTSEALEDFVIRLRLQG
jgi:hypothetical protein